MADPKHHKSEIRPIENNIKDVQYESLLMRILPGAIN